MKTFKIEHLNESYKLSYHAEFFKTHDVFYVHIPDDCPLAAKASQDMIFLRPISRESSYEFGITGSSTPFEQDLRITIARALEELANREIE
jgi:hypothetical protein